MTFYKVRGSHLLSDLSGVSCRQIIQIWQQGTGFQHSLVPAFLFFPSKQNVVLQTGILDPSLLGNVGNGALYKQKRRNAEQTIKCKDEIFCNLINGLEIMQNIK